MAGGDGAGRVPHAGDGPPRLGRGGLGGDAGAVPGGDAGAARRHARRGRPGRRVPHGRRRPAREPRDARLPRDLPHAGDGPRPGRGRGLGGRRGRRRAAGRRGDHEGRVVLAGRGASTGIGIGIAAGAAKPRNRANRHCRWQAYQPCRARSFVRRALVASTPGSPSISDRPAADPVAALPFYYYSGGPGVRTPSRRNRPAPPGRPAAHLPGTAGAVYGGGMVGPVGPRAAGGDRRC